LAQADLVREPLQTQMIMLKVLTGKSLKSVPDSLQLAVAVAVGTCNLPLGNLTDAQVVLAAEQAQVRQREVQDRLDLQLKIQAMAMGKAIVVASDIGRLQEVETLQVVAAEPEEPADLQLETIKRVSVVLA
jgi:hypothetical protein